MASYTKHSYSFIMSNLINDNIRIQSFLSCLLGYNDEQCNHNSKSAPPLLFSGYALTDENILVRFFKPIPDGYFYKLSYWINHMTGGATIIRQPTKFCPAFSKLISHLHPNSTYEINLGLYCENTNDTMSDRPKIHVKTLTKCKWPLCLKLKDKTNESWQIYFFVVVPTTLPPPTTTPGNFTRKIDHHNFHNACS